MSLTVQEAVKLLSSSFHRDEPVWCFTQRAVFHAGKNLYDEEFVGTPLEENEEEFKAVFSPFEAIAVAEKIIQEQIDDQMADREIREG